MNRVVPHSGRVLERRGSSKEACSAQDCSVWILPARLFGRFDDGEASTYARRYFTGTRACMTPALGAGLMSKSI